jgi:CheY-like chemotaxis protein
MLTAPFKAERSYVMLIKKKILLIDDEPALLNILKMRLTACGCIVLGLTDPLEALKQFKINPETFELIITDYRMPGLNGYELIKKAKELRPDIDTMILSGNANAISSEMIDEIGINEVLEKPVLMADLIDKIIQL